MNPSSPMNPELHTLLWSLYGSNPSSTRMLHTTGQSSLAVLHQMAPESSLLVSVPATYSSIGASYTLPSLGFLVNSGQIGDAWIVLVPPHPLLTFHCKNQFPYPGLLQTS